MESCQSGCTSFPYILVNNTCNILFKLVEELTFKRYSIQTGRGTHFQEDNVVKVAEFPFRFSTIWMPCADPKNLAGMFVLLCNGFMQIYTDMNIKVGGDV